MYISLKPTHIRRPRWSSCWLLAGLHWSRCRDTRPFHCAWSSSSLIARHRTGPLKPKAEIDSARANIVYRPEQTVAFDINVQTGSLRREEPGTGFIGETFSVKWNPFFRREGEGEGERKGQRAAREGKRKKGERKKRNPLEHASIYEANFPVLFFIIPAVTCLSLLLSISTK